MSKQSLYARFQHKMTVCLPCRIYLELPRKHQLKVSNCQLRLAYLGERSSESPQSAETAALQEVQRLLRGVLAGQHVLDDALHRSEHDLIVGHRQHVVYLLVEQRVAVAARKRTNILRCF